MASALVSTLGAASVAEAVTATMGGSLKIGQEFESPESGSDTNNNKSLSNFSVSLSETTDGGTTVSSSFMLTNEGGSAPDDDNAIKLTFSDGSALELLNAGNAAGTHAVSVPGASGEQGIAVTTSNGAPTGTSFGAGATAFTTPNVFDDGLKTYPVEVFVQGLRMRVGTASSCDYYIQAPNKIYFNYGLEADRRVIARVGFGHTVQEEQFTATQGQTTFNIPGDPANQEKFHAYLNGVLLRRVTDYTCGSPVVLGEACKAGDEVILMSASAEDLFTANEGQTKFTPTDTGTTSDNVQVYLNGIYLEETTDWTMGSPSVTIINPATGLEVGDELDVLITR